MRLCAIIATTLACAGILPAQVTTIDEGSFTLYVKGEQVGREHFSIHRAPDAGGFSILAQSNVSRGDRTLAAALRTDTLGRLLGYSLNIRDSSGANTSVSATISGGRVRVRVATAVGDASGEMRLDPQAVVLDEEVVHQYYFVARHLAAGHVQVLVPGKMARDSLRLGTRGQGPVEVGNGTVPGTHLTVVDGSGILTDLWVDRMGRVLRLAVPARNFVAVRDEPPR